MAAGLGGSQGYDYSLTGHVVAMVLLGGLSVVLAASLVRAGNVPCAAILLLGAALGPMTIVAAPVRGDLVRPDWNDTVPWWHVLVGLTVAGCLAAWTRAVVRHDAHLPRPSRDVPQVAVFVLGAAVTFLVCLTTRADLSGPASPAGSTWAWRRR